MASGTRRTVAIGLLPVLALVASCDSERLQELRPGDSSAVTDAPQPTDAPDGGAPATDPPETAPSETAPPETAPPETAPPETAPPATDAPIATDPAEPTIPSEDDGDGSSTWLVIVLVLLGVGVAVALITAATRRKPEPTEDPRRRMLSTARWIHDQLSLEILALPPGDAQVRWNTERVRFDQLVIDLRSIAPSQQNPVPWDALAQSIGALASSLDSAVRVRVSPDADPDLVGESVTIANRHRADLQRTLLVVEQTI